MFNWKRFFPVAVLAILTLGVLSACGDDPFDGDDEPTATSSQSTPTSKAQPTPDTVVKTGNGSGEVCRLAVVGPWSEINGVAPYRIEVGGGDIQHMDYYPLIGVQTVSYIVPPLNRGGVADKWFGYGQMWQGNNGPCASWPWVDDATDYARGNASGQPGRVQQGHSGVVVDLRGGDFKVVANTQDLDDSVVEALLACHKAGMGQEASASACTSVRFNPDGGSSSDGQCGDATGMTLEMGNHTVNGPAIANVWTNRADAPSWGQEQVKVLVPDGTTLNLIQVGGKVWNYDSGCSEDHLQEEYANTGLTPKTIADLRQYNLAE